ncbi:MAG: hypothetical protein ACYCU8_00730 [Ferrimicrobium acidiphilum]|jgi:hypothetical protein
MQSILEYVAAQVKENYDEDGDLENMFLGEIQGNKDDTEEGICDIPGCDKKRTSSVEFDFLYGDATNGEYEVFEQELYVCTRHYYDIALEAEESTDDRMGRAF